MMFTCNFLPGNKLASIRSENNIKIFLSYSHNDNDVANKIDSDLTDIGLEVVRDVHNIEPLTDDLEEFMQQIRECNYALLIISDSYLECVTHYLTRFT